MAGRSPGTYDRSAPNGVVAAQVHGVVDGSRNCCTRANRDRRASGVILRVHIGKVAMGNCDWTLEQIGANRCKHGME
jgi:hypothetical protein